MMMILFLFLFAGKKGLYVEALVVVFVVVFLFFLFFNVLASSSYHDERARSFEILFLFC